MTFEYTADQISLCDSVRKMLREIATPEYIRATAREGR